MHRGQDGHVIHKDMQIARSGPGAFKPIRNVFKYAFVKYSVGGRKNFVRRAHVDRGESLGFRGWLEALFGGFCRVRWSARPRFSCPSRPTSSNGAQHSNPTPPRCRNIISYITS
jgi:hypothetical protein